MSRFLKSLVMKAQLQFGSPFRNRRPMKFINETFNQLYCKRPTDLSPKSTASLFVKSPSQYVSPFRNVHLSSIRTAPLIRFYSTDDQSNVPPNPNQQNLLKQSEIVNVSTFSSRMRAYDEAIAKLEHRYKDIAPENAKIILGIVIKELAELKVDYENNVTELKSTKALVNEYRLLLGIRTKIESLEERLWPSTEPKKPNLSRTEIWNFLLLSEDGKFSKNESIVEFRQRLLNQEMAPEFFIEKVVKRLYKYTSDIGAHKVKLPPAKEIDQNILEAMLITIGLDTDTGLVKGLRMIIEPLKTFEKIRAKDEKIAAEKAGITEENKTKVA